MLHPLGIEQHGMLSLLLLLENSGGADWSESKIARGRGTIQVTPWPSHHTTTTLLALIPTGEENA